MIQCVLRRLLRGFSTCTSKTAKEGTFGACDLSEDVFMKGMGMPMVEKTAGYGLQVCLIVA